MRSKEMAGPRTSSMRSGRASSNSPACTARCPKRFVRERLSAYAYPRKIEFVDDLPKTLTGKIRRIELRERVRAAAAT